MATFKFIIKESKVNKKGLTIIRLQYCHGKDKIELSTGEKIEPRYWDKMQGKPKSRCPDWSYLDEQLEKVTKKYLQSLEMLNSKMLNQLSTT